MESTTSLFDWLSVREATRPAAATARIVIFDCETTGIDCAVDQIIELCVQRGLVIEDAPGAVTTWRLRPSVPIHPRAQAVHGISAAELEGCPAFSEVADAIAEVFAAADVVIGYNVAFDIEMLHAEYARIGRPPPDFAAKQIVDAFRLWQHCEPRSLQHAHQRFVGNGFEAAHSASADVAATARVLAGMLEHFKLAGQDWAQLASVSGPRRREHQWIGPSRHLRWDGDAIVIAFGELAGTPVHAIDRDALAAFAERGDVPDHVREVCRAALEFAAPELQAWARERFGQAAPTAQPPFAK